jgi:hypothetical protein
VNIGTKVTPKDKIFVDDLLLKSDMRIERPKIWMVRNATCGGSDLS